MLRINKKTEYGILALLYLDSLNQKVASVREISSHCSIPEPLLGKIMQKLKKHFLVSPVYGNSGGYRLAKGLTDINLQTLNEILSGPVRLVECLQAEKHSCPAQSKCSIATPMHTLNQKILGFFEATTLHSLIERAPQNPTLLQKELA